MVSKGQLLVTTYEAGVRPPSLSCTLRNIHASRLFDADREAFFTLYAPAGPIGDAHLRNVFLEASLEYVTRHPEATVRVSGHFGNRDLMRLGLVAKAAGIAVTIRSVPSLRTLRLITASDLVFSCPSLTEAVEKAGSPADAVPAQFWEPWFKEFFSEVVLSGLKIRSETPFFDFLRETAAYTARPVNWTAVARAAGISQATAYRWSEVLERLALIDLIDSVESQGKRRILRREKLYWTAPGLALWLTRADLSTTEVLNRYVENLLYLALKDASSEGRFSYALDTNKKALPILQTLGGVKSAYFVTHDGASRTRALSSARGYAKLKVIDTAYAVNLDHLSVSDAGLRVSAQPLL